jgi:DNA-binding beta-propeller fold protein YncE
MRPWRAAGALALLGAACGCGNQYRPVVTPVQPTGPASSPLAYAVVLSQPGGVMVPPAGTPTCPTEQGVATVLDFAGDTVTAQAFIDSGAYTFGMDPTGSTAVTENCDGTLNTVPISSTLQTKNVQSSTLLGGAQPINTLVSSASTLYVIDKGRDVIEYLTGSPPGLKYELPISSSPINATGISNGQRVYAITQGNQTQTQTWGACDDPSSQTIHGEADALETATITISAHIPVGVCPVYGYSTPDGLRTFIMNRGSGTVSVINSQFNQLDAAHPSIAVGAGPVFADYYSPSQVLVVANYDGNSVSFIDVSTDVYGNDSPTFGTVLATVPVGVHPAALTVLQDGSRVYVANKGDGTSSGNVTVINMSSFKVEKTISLPATIGSLLQPRSIVSSYVYPNGKVYVVSQNSEYVTVIRTDTDEVSTAIQVQGNAIDVHVTTQYAGASKTQPSLNGWVGSRSPGSGAP